MIRWTPSWGDLASDLVAEPDARPSLLSRFAVPARGPWFWAAMWVLVAAAVFVALIPVLRGLADRVEALDGHLYVTSPPGEGTVVTAELPVASGA